MKCSFSDTPFSPSDSGGTKIVERNLIRLIVSVTWMEVRGGLSLAIES